MGARFDILDADTGEDVFSCTGRGARRLLDLMDQAGQDLTLVSACQYFALFPAEGSDALEHPTEYSARTILTELDTLLSLITQTTPTDMMEGLSWAQWTDWLTGLRETIALHPDRRYRAVYCE